MHWEHVIMLRTSYKQWKQSVSTDNKLLYQSIGSHGHTMEGCCTVALLRNTNERHLNPNMNFSHSRIPIRIWRLCSCLRVPLQAKIWTLNEGVNLLGMTGWGIMRRITSTKPRTRTPTTPTKATRLRNSTKKPVDSYVSRIHMKIRSIPKTWAIGDYLVYLRPKLWLFKVRYRLKMVEWVLSKFDSASNAKDLYKVVPNAKQALTWCFMLWEEMHKSFKIVGGR